MKKVTLTTTIFIEYSDNSKSYFDVTITGTEEEIEGQLLMITRGALWAFHAHMATCYKDGGIELCRYLNHH